MNQKDLKPVSQLVDKYGVKMVAYGPPGSGKTPLASTAPRPVLCAVEPGLLSMRSSNIPAYDAFTAERLDDFFKWFFESNEANNFDTLCIDSISQVAELYLGRELKKHSHGLKAYGEMAVKVKEKTDKLFYLKNKHVYMIAKQGKDEKTGYATPYFPGKDLNTYIPHQFDLVAHLGKEFVQGVGEVPAIRTADNALCFARDRTGLLAELEPMDLTALFKKAMA